MLSLERTGEIRASRFGRPVFLAILVSVSSICTGFAQERLSENDIDWCKENLTYYLTLGRTDFLKNHQWSMRARVCSHLYSDPLWSSKGANHTANLIKRSAHYMHYEIELSQERADANNSDLVMREEASTSGDFPNTNPLHSKVVRGTIPQIERLIRDGARINGAGGIFWTRA